MTAAVLTGDFRCRLCQTRAETAPADPSHWQCPRCMQWWSPDRMTTVDAYAAYVERRLKH